MAKASWRGAVLAEAALGDTQEVEGNIYFPLSALKREHLRASDHQTTCAWKGLASYYDVVVGSKVNANAAWYYPEPKSAAASIRDHVAFWKGVTVER